MIKAYKKELPYKDWNEVRIIDLETGDFRYYMQDKKIGFIFSEYKTNINAMGYKTAKECLKTLKSRDCLGKEIDYTEQLQSEKSGFINLGIERIKRHNRVNTKDFEDVIEKLSNYGLGFCDAQNQIIAAYMNCI
jgi:hypothetical protein